MAYGANCASIILHRNVLFGIIRSPMKFFDITPVGRILARFSNDINTVDNTLPANLRQWLPCLLRVGS